MSNMVWIYQTSIYRIYRRRLSQEKNWQKCATRCDSAIAMLP